MAKITNIRSIRTRSSGTWVIVKVETDQPGLYGIGSASDHYRAKTVMAAVEQITPLLLGREAGHIEDNWQSVYTSSYWRNGSIENTALAAIDMALWDIKGKEAGMPVFPMVGGPFRGGGSFSFPASCGNFQKLEGGVCPYHLGGYPLLRCPLGAHGGGGVFF